MLHPYKVKHVYPHEDIPIEYDCWGNVTKYAKAQEINPGDQKSFGFFYSQKLFFLFFLKLLCGCRKEKQQYNTPPTYRHKETTPVHEIQRSLLLWFGLTFKT